MGLFDSLTRSFSGRDSRLAAIAQSMGLERGLGALSSTYGQGRDAATQSYQAGMKPFQTLFDQGSAASGAYADALGLNGQAGNDAARSRFQTSPGYEFARDQGLQATERGINAGGMLASGNLLDALQKQGTGYAAQDWSNYLGRFKGLMDQQTAGAQGLGTMNAHLGNTLNANYMGQGNAANATYTGQGQTEGAAYLGGQQAASRRMQGLTDAASLAVSLATGMPSGGGGGGGGGSFGSQLMSMFGGTGGQQQPYIGDVMQF